MLKLYHAAASVCSIKVRLGLAEIGLAYEAVELDLAKGDQHDPAYLALNPEGVVPTLIDDGLVLVESSLILDYLDRERNGGKLMPEGRAAEATARHWLLRCLAIHAAINTLTFSTVNRARTLAARTPEQIDAALARMPDPIMRAKRKALFEQGLDSAYVDQALRHLRGAFADMASALDRGAWVSGAAFGLSDIALLAYLDRLERLGFEGLWAEDRPTIGAWLERMQARPSYAAEVLEKLDPSAAKGMREEGQTFWPALGRRWRELG